MKRKPLILLATTIILLLIVSYFMGPKDNIVPLTEENTEQVASNDYSTVEEELSELNDSHVSTKIEEDQDVPEINEKNVETEATSTESSVEQEITSSPKSVENSSQEESNKIVEDQTNEEEISQQVEEETSQETEVSLKTENNENELEEEPTKTISYESKEELIAQQKKEKEQIIAKDNANIDKKDKYFTDPVPEGKPKPVEWQDVTINEEKELTATLSVTCKTILNNMDLFNKDKLEVLPEDGVIYPKQTVTFYEGESVFDVLVREMRKNGIHIEFEMTPMYNSHYIEGINNIYEFDCGELSGWMYKVNGWFPNYGASRYQLKNNDVIEWVYTCDLGRDVGGFKSLMGEDQ